MNKLYFSSNVLNVYSQDLQYLQDNVGIEIQKILLAVTGNIAEPVISAGFLCEVSQSDNTKLRVYQTDGTTTSTGAILTADGIIATSVEEYDGIELADYSSGMVNYVYARYSSIDATYKIKDGTIVFEKKAIDLNTYLPVYNRKVDLIEIVVYTLAQYNALSETEKGHSIFLGSVIGRGIGHALTGVDGTYRKYLSAAIPDNSIELIKLVSNFMLPQVMVETSNFINDSYYGVPANIEDDLNRIRTVIKDIKSTDTWETPSTGIKASDPDINHLHRSGLFNNLHNVVVYAGDGVIPTSTGCIVYTSTGEQGAYINSSAPFTSTGQGIVISSGKILYKASLRELTSSTGLMLSDPNIYQIGNYVGTLNGDTDYELVTTSSGNIPQGTTFQLAHYPIQNLILTMVIFSNYFTLTEGLHYSVDYEAGTFTIILPGGINPDSDWFRAFYKWGEQRIDTIVLSTSSGLTVLEGIPVASYEVPQPPIFTSSSYPICSVHFPVLQTRFYQKDITYHHINIAPIREVREILPTAINHYDINGNFNPMFIEGMQRLNLLTSIGGVPLELGNGYTITSTGDFPYIQTSTGVVIHTDIFTQTDDEVYVLVFQQISDYTLTINIETVSNSDIYDETISLLVPRRNIVVDEPILLFVYKGLSEGYHKINITGDITYSLNKIVIGKLDTYYLKDKLYVSTVASNRIDAQSLRLDWVTAHDYLIEDIVEKDGNFYKCTANHTSNTFLSDVNIFNYWENVGANSTTVTYLNNQVEDMKIELEKVELVNLEQQLRLNTLEGRNYSNSDIQIENYMSEEMTFDYETDFNIPVEILDDNDWYNNIKEQFGDTVPKFKSGFARPRKQPYMLEIIDEYNIEGVGQTYKGTIEYDQTNNCYWMITNAGVSGIGQISKLSTSMKNGKVEEIAKWYIPAVTNMTWAGITSDGTYLFTVMFGNNINSSKVYGYNINTNGTIGLGSLPSGETLALETGTTISNCSYSSSNNIITMTSGTTASIRVGRYVSGSNFNTCKITAITSPITFTVELVPSGSGTSLTTWDHYTVSNTASGFYYNDVISYNSTDVAVLGCNASTAVTLIMLSKANLANAGVASNITGFAPYIGGTNFYGRSVTKYGNDLYIRMDDTTDDKRFIYKFNLTTDIVSSAVIKSSGKFENSRNVDGDGAANVSGGITVGSKGDLLEVVATPSNGRFIARRALKNALWAENQLSFEYKFGASTNPSGAIGCMVEDNRYIWTADTGVTANEVDIYRFDTQTNSYKHARLTNQAWTGVMNLTYNPTTDVLYLLGVDGTNYEVFYGDLSDFVALMANTYDTSAGNNILIGHVSDSRKWGTIASGIGAANTNKLTGMCYNPDTSLIYIVNDTNDKIDTLSLNGSTWTQGVLDLPSAIVEWQGIAYKNSKFYIVDWAYTSTYFSRIWVLDISRSTSSKWFVTHRYQDMVTFTNTTNYLCGIDFINNELIGINYNTLLACGAKTLEDDDVLQLHTFLDSNNILLSNYVMTTTPITERYFSPEEFSDPRNVPDQFYMAVGYGDEGFSVLHLDNFLNRKSSTGKDRFNVSDIRVWHFKRGSGASGTQPHQTGYNLAGSQNAYSNNIYIEKDILFSVAYNINYTINPLIDLKNGKTIAIWGGTHTGYYYNGTLSERNDNKMYAGTYNVELDLTGSVYPRKLHARTFTKDDESDYSGVNPVTFVAIGTDGGCDLLRIDWDENGNRTPVKVWNNIFGGVAVYGIYANFIAPSGKMFGISHDTAGNVVTLAIHNGSYSSHTPIYVWEVNADGANSQGATYYIEIGSALIADYGRDISPNSRCWKTTSGTWRHQLIYGSNVLTVGYKGGTGIIDIENVSVERLWNSAAAYYGSDSVDIFEDKILSPINESETFRGFHILKKNRFNPKAIDRTSSIVPLNNWDSILNPNGLTDQTRPAFLSGCNSTSGQGQRADTIGGQNRFSKDFNNILVSTKVYGVQMIWMSQSNNNVYESKDFTINQPSKIIYNEQLLTPFGD